MGIEQLNSKKAHAFISKLERAFDKLPEFPDGLIDFIVRLIPFLAILGLIASGLQVFMSIRLLFQVLGRPALSPGELFSLYLVLRIALQLLGAYILYRAVRPLLNRQLLGWILLFWNEIINAGNFLLELIFGSGGSGFSLFASIIIALYILFEIKPRYSPNDS